MSPRRIMMISTHGYVAANPELGNPDTGGQVVYVLELSRCLARMGYQVDIFTRQFEDQPACENVAARVQLVRIPCGGRNFIPKEDLWHSIPEWVSGAAEFVRANRWRYEFINSHYWDAGLAGQALARRWSVPHLHTPHSIGSWKRDNMPGTPEQLESTYNFSRRIREEKGIYDECDGLIATTPLQRSILQASEYDVPLEKIQTIPPGYDDARFYPVSLATRAAIKQSLGLSGQIVLAIGRLARNKGYDLLIRAMQPVFERVADARLLLAIGGNEQTDGERRQLAELQALSESLGYGERVIFRDYVPDADLANYYRAADVFALSSRYEPFGMTAIEAMACGTPTVVTTEGGLWEQVRWGLEALYANPNDTESFGHSICEILQFEQIRDQLARYGSQKARARFTWNGVAQEVLSASETARGSCLTMPLLPTALRETEEVA